MSDLLEQFDYSPGKVIYDELKFSLDLPLTEQEDNLKEDLLQIEFPNNILLDVGWKPEFNSNGEFFVSVIQNYDWLKPIFQARVKNIESLILSLKEACSICKKPNE